MKTFPSLVALLIASQATGSSNRLTRPTSLSSPATSTTPTDSTEIRILRAQLSVQREYKEDLLQTVYFTLATVGGVALVLIGYSWYTNFRVIERDRQLLIDEISNNITKQLATARSELNETQRRGAEATSVQIKETIRAEITSALTDIERRTSSMSSRLDAIAREQRMLRIADQEGEARYWELKKVPGNEVDRYLEILRIAASAKADFEISTALTNLIRLGKQGALPYWGHIPDLAQLLASLDPKFSNEVAVFNELLKKASRE